MNRRVLRATVVSMLALAPLTAGCGAGENAATLEVRPDHPSGDVGDVGVRSLMLVTRSSGGESAAVVTLVNTGAEPQTLDSVQIGPPTGGTSAPLDVPAGIRVPPNGAVNVGADGQPSLPVAGLDDVAAAGSLVPVTLIFDKAGRLTLEVLVQEATGPYESFLPSPVATPSPMPSPSGTTSPATSPSPSPTSTS